MFDSHLPFLKLTEKSQADPSFHIRTISYSIKPETGRYIIDVEEYIDDTFVVKFYPASHKNDSQKFQLITGSNVLMVVMGTCLEIFRSIYEGNQSASFGFIATQSIIGDFIEEKANNQRFRIYRQTMQNYFGDETFNHFVDVTNSAYLMVNRCKDIRLFVQGMQEKFSEMYKDLLGLQFTEL